MMVVVGGGIAVLGTGRWGQGRARQGDEVAGQARWRFLSGGLAGEASLPERLDSGLRRNDGVKASK